MPPIRPCCFLLAAAVAACGDYGGPGGSEPETTDRGIVFRATGDEVQGELYYINTDGTGLLRLTTDTSYQDHPAVSPDGQSVAFTCRPDPGNIEICVMNINGSGVVRLTSDTAIDAMPRWSPDGQTIVFASEQGHAGIGRDLWTMSASGTSQTPLTDGGDVVYERARYAPAGDRLVLTYRDIPGAVDLYFINASGTGLTPFRAAPEVEDLATWSPDGERIAYNRRIGAIQALVIHTLAGGFVKVLDSTSLDGPAWSHDGRELVASCPNGAGNGLCRVTPTGKRVTRIPNVPAGAASPDWVE